MDVSSDLKNASLEVWVTADEANIKAKGVARIGYNLDLNRMRIYDGTEFKTVASQADVTADKIGDIKASVLDSTQFVAEHDTTWLPMIGQSLYAGEPTLLAADYPELAALRPDWVDDFDFGSGLDTYIFIPDTRHTPLIGLGDGFSTTIRPEIGSSPIVDLVSAGRDLTTASLTSAHVGSKNLTRITDHYHRESLNGDPSTKIVPLAAGPGGYTGFGFESKTFPAGTDLYVPHSSVFPATDDRDGGYVGGILTSTDSVGQNNIPQCTAVNFYIKAKR